MFIKKQKYMDEISLYNCKVDTRDRVIFDRNREIEKLHKSNRVFNILRRLMNDGFTVEIKANRISVARNNMVADYELSNYVEDSDFALAIEQAEMLFLKYREEQIEKLIATKKSGE